MNQAYSSFWPDFVLHPWRCEAFRLLSFLSAIGPLSCTSILRVGICQFLFSPWIARLLIMALRRQNQYELEKDDYDEKETCSIAMLTGFWTYVALSKPTTIAASPPLKALSYPMLGTWCSSPGETDKGKGGDCIKSTQKGQFQLQKWSSKYNIPSPKGYPRRVPRINYQLENCKEKHPKQYETMNAWKHHPFAQTKISLPTKVSCDRYSILKINLSRDYHWIHDSKYQVHYSSSRQVTNIFWLLFCDIFTLDPFFTPFHLPPPQLRATIPSESLMIHQSHESFTAVGSRGDLAAIFVDPTVFQNIQILPEGCCSTALPTANLHKFYRQAFLEKCSGKAQSSQWASNSPQILATRLERPRLTENTTMTHRKQSKAVQIVRFSCVLTFLIIQHLITNTTPSHICPSAYKHCFRITGSLFSFFGHCIRRWIFGPPHHTRSLWSCHLGVTCTLGSSSTLRSPDSRCSDGCLPKPNKNIGV